MDEDRMDAAVAEVVLGLVRARRDLDPDTFRDMVGSIMVEIDQGLEVALERAHRRTTAPREGNVVPFLRPPGQTDQGSG